MPVAREGTEEINVMNVASKRSWVVNFLRLPETVEEQASGFYYRVPADTRFWLANVALALCAAFLTARGALESVGGFLRFVGLAAVVAVIFFALYKATTRSRSLRLKADTTFRVTTTAIVLQLLLVRVGEFIAVELMYLPDVSRFGGSFGFQFAIPYAACALVLSVLVGSQIALLAAMVVALFVGLISGAGLPMGLFALVSSVAAIAGVERYRTRNAISRAIMTMGGVNVLASLVTPLVAGQPLSAAAMLNGALLGLLGALLTAAAASLATPIYESAFNILTDLKLLELSNADNPLLRDLAIKTPGTNHHSFIVATLAEAAAKAIGANALLARTGGLYHDIGKMAAPRMYIENQKGQENPHDKVGARDSVRIVTGHVRRGIKLGHEAGLPPQIIDFIPQHHGTRILAYFYHKAKSEAEARGETVNPDDFRYPGPKPQTKETVILMLADGAEAAVRSLQDPTPENIRAIVKKIIDHIVADGQFDESDVTFEELNKIRESIIATLTSIYHQRVSYPGFNPPANGQPQAEEKPKDAEPPVPPSLQPEANEAQARAQKQA
jgi:cyclic-di-AMP phosphodiesterase PgpH